MAEPTNFLPREEAVPKAVRAIRQAVGDDPVTSEEGMQGLYRQIMGENSDVSMTSFRRAIQQLAVGQGNKPFRLEQGRVTDGKSRRRASLIRTRSRQRGTHS